MKKEEAKEYIKKLEAFDENKNPICYDINSLHEYITKYHKK